MNRMMQRVFVSLCGQKIVFFKRTLGSIFLLFLSGCMSSPTHSFLRDKTDLVEGSLTSLDGVYSNNVKVGGSRATLWEVLRGRSYLIRANAKGVVSPKVRVMVTQDAIVFSLLNAEDSTLASRRFQYRYDRGTILLEKQWVCTGIPPLIWGTGPYQVRLSLKSDGSLVTEDSHSISAFIAFIPIDGGQVDTMRNEWPVLDQ